MSKKLKLTLKIIVIIILVIIVFGGVIAVVNVIGANALKKMAGSFETVENNNAAIPVQDDDGYYTYTLDRELKIQMFTDVHIGAGFLSFKKDRMALNAVAAMISYEKPDLVVITGDVIYPAPGAAGTVNNLTEAKVFAELMEKLGVYWTVAFGNHDQESYTYYGLETIAEFYESSDLEHCIFTRGPLDVSGEGNQIIKVKNSAGILTQALVLFDSHSYIRVGGKKVYANINLDQEEWYESEIKKLNDENAAVLSRGSADFKATYENLAKVKSLAFFHIPLIQYDEAWNAYKNGEDSAVYYYGDKKEGVYHGQGKDTVFDRMVKLGSTQGIFCGHDHVNNFSIDYKGIRLTYGMSIDFLAYRGIHKKGSQRGCTLIFANPDGTFSCRPENYYQDKYVSKYGKESVSFE